ncbi:hypothetical protein [Prevotella veroralis]|uniref:DUF8188 domain-containing protein n=1 Tax=Prevotella veroralis F0319 TaxID=649761 RepID=C9MS48_9BACT|nr:hypothetical protein [Prevotella veroralis]EEX17708.1 hypothetical protein HMPREF0973_02461 [Prevotella veroralis F0319]QUB42197.1 hypothetical protein J5A55_10055 [Prevotella veroralis]
MRKNSMGWFTGVGLVAMLLAIGNLIYTCTRNDGEKYAQQYIDESEYVTLHIPERKGISYEPNYITTGVVMNSAEILRTDSIRFYDSSYRKYFCVLVIEKKRRNMVRQSMIVVNDIAYRKTIRARINKYELNSPRYGSKENPVPVLDYDYDLQEFRDAYDDKEYEYAFSRPAYYKRAVELYLTYMMSKEEFKERFEKE